MVYIELSARIRIALRLTVLVMTVLACGVSCTSREDGVNVAVAANFTEPAKELAELFQQTNRHSVLPSFGSTLQLLTQITQDAPFDIFLAADEASPQKAIAAGFAEQDSLFTYAIGRVVLLSGSLDVSAGADVLRNGQFEKLAIANPSTAPYGAAAVQTMKSLGLYEQLSPKFVQGNDIAQTFQFVETGNAEIGFVALSQVLGKGPKSIWIVPENIYSPIRQDAVLLKKAASKESARTFLAFLKSPSAIKVIEKYGYRTAE
jgi:molybdate transport system substrate-binding protein